MDYNTQREKLMMPEYGRSIQQMVKYCKTIPDREERNRCAASIVDTMADMVTHNTDKDDFHMKLWNHLAAIAEYELDVDYPVEIERMDEKVVHPEHVEYPQHKIANRNYGVIVEKFADHIANAEQGEQLDELNLLLANHMKRDLSNWSVDSMSDERVAEDFARLTGGKAAIDLNRQHLVSDGELLSSRVSTSVKKKKKK